MFVPTGCGLGGGACENIRKTLAFLIFPHGSGICLSLCVRTVSPLCRPLFTSRKCLGVVMGVVQGSGITSFLPPVPLSPLASPFLPSLPPLFLPPFLPLLFIFLKQCLLSIYSCQAMHSDVQKLILYSGSLQSSRGQICLKSNDHSNKCRMNNYSKLMKRQMIP